MEIEAFALFPAIRWWWWWWWQCGHASW